MKIFKYIYQTLTTAIGNVSRQFPIYTWVVEIADYRWFIFCACLKYHSVVLEVYQFEVHHHQEGNKMILDKQYYDQET